MTYRICAKPGKQPQPHQPMYYGEQVRVGQIIRQETYDRWEAELKNPRHPRRKLPPNAADIMIEG